MDLPARLTVLLGASGSPTSLPGMQPMHHASVRWGRLPTARKGNFIRRVLKLLMPVIVVLPGIAAYVLYQQACFKPRCSTPKASWM